MPKVRKDSKGRNLRPGETQRTDGTYMYVHNFRQKRNIFMMQILRNYEKEKNRLRKIVKTAYAHKMLPGLP